MDFLDLVKRRKSTRSFLKKDIPKENIETCIEAARLAPSACNSQPWKFVIVTDQQNKEKVVEAILSGIYTDRSGINAFIRTAPVIVAIVNEKMKLTARTGAFIRKIDYSLLDSGIAGEHFVLAATELGISTCWVGWFNESKLKKVLGVPKKKRITCLIAMGYAKNDSDKQKIRKEISEISSFEKY
ncbi:MAG: nitroreductase family protein [Candidatus Aureabacteria bacterium]|nr:nitroreductase family protein [Candidatus Auribacterota bacterium]